MRLKARETTRSSTKARQTTPFHCQTHCLPQFIVHCPPDGSHFSRTAARRRLRSRPARLPVLLAGRRLIKRNCPMCPSPGRRPLESGVQSARAWQAVAWHFRHPFLRRHPRHAPRRQIISKRHGSRGPFPQDSPRHSRRLPPRGQHRPVQPPRRVPSGPSQALTTSSAKSNGRSCRPKRTTKTERSSWVSSRPNPRSSPVALVLILALVLTPRSPNPATLALVLVLAESSFPTPALPLPLPLPQLSFVPTPSLLAMPQASTGGRSPRRRRPSTKRH